MLVSVIDMRMATYSQAIATIYMDGDPKVLGFGVDFENGAVQNLGSVRELRAYAFGLTPERGRLSAVGDIIAANPSRVK